MEAWFKRAKPVVEAHNQCVPEIAPVSRPTLADIDAFRNFRTGSPEVDEVVTKQNLIDLRVMTNIVFVGLAAGKAVMRVGLEPPATVILMVNVVAKGLFSASRQNRLLPLISVIVPVIVERHSFRHSHREYQVAFPSLALASGTHHPVPNFRTFSNLGLARGEGTDPEKWIRRKAIVSRDDVGV